MDVGKCLEEMEVFHNGADKIHIDNKHLHALGDELTDVADEYKALEGTEWDKAYTKAYEEWFTNKEA